MFVKLVSRSKSNISTHKYQVIMNDIVVNSVIQLTCVLYYRFPMKTILQSQDGLAKKSVSVFGYLSKYVFGFLSIPLVKMSVFSCCCMIFNLKCRIVVISQITEMHTR